MSVDLLLRTLSLCVALAGVETLHGIARTVWLVPRIGKARALKVSALTGSLLALGVCFLLVPDFGLRGPWPHVALGLMASGFMAGFDIVMARWVLRKAWHKVWPDFNPATGNYLTFGLIVLASAPWVVAWTLGLA